MPNLQAGTAGFLVTHRASIAPHGIQRQEDRKGNPASTCPRSAPAENAHTLHQDRARRRGATSASAGRARTFWIAVVLIVALVVAAVASLALFF